MSASNLQSLEETLSTSAFLQGSKPSALDNKVFKEFESAPDSASFPNVYGWYLFINQFAEHLRSTWPDLTPKVVPKVEEPAKEAAQEAKDDEDWGEDDLFGDDPNAEEEAKKIAEGKAGHKAAPVGKSNVVFDVKPVGSTIDLDELAKRIFAEVTLDGLIWGEQYKKAPVAFGIFKLIVGCTILDTVETEVIIEKISEISGPYKVEDEDENGEGLGTFTDVDDVWVQSVDIANFQKI